MTTKKLIFVHVEKDFAGKDSPMTVWKKAICALALVGAVTVPVNSNAQVLETGLFAGMSGAAIAGVIAGIIALGVVINEVSDDGKSG
jgi:hypothetical protein